MREKERHQAGSVASGRENGFYVVLSVEGGLRDCSIIKVLCMIEAHLWYAHIMSYSRCRFRPHILPSVKFQ